MKKIISRILLLLFMLIFGFQQFCYADMIAISPAQMLFIPAVFFLGAVCFCVLITSLISYLSLKALVKKQTMPEHDKSNVMSDEDIEKEKKRIKHTIYICGAIVAISVLIYLCL